MNMILLQLVLFCALFTLLVRLSVLGGAVNALYFYPPDYQKTAYARGIADPAVIQAKRKRFMLPFVLTMFAALLLIVGAWNKALSFSAAYCQSLLFLEVMNWYDGIVIDRVWVGHSRFWVIPGMEGEPYVQTWKQVKAKRGKLTLIFAAGAVIPAGILCLLARL